MIDDDIKEKKYMLANAFGLLMFHEMHDLDEDQLSHSNSGKAIQHFGF
jgi:hypothetical protein